MADIRRTPLLDDFERADVNPIDGPWAKADLGWTTNLRIDTGRAQGNVGDTVYYYTGGGPWDGDVEVWGIAGPGIDVTEAFRLALFTSVGGTNAVDGYILLMIAGSGWSLRKYVNRSSVATLAGSAESTPGDGQLALLRRNGNDVECWRSNDGGANWTLILSATDTDYTTNLYVCMGISSDDGNNPSWEGIGGGAHRNRTQIYRWIKN